ncbi:MULTISPECIES: NAD(P)-binding domain-containing protein [unclassified Cytobacillus]|uniref:NAD(P)-binding domain-containing protein n=1 Tax=unclassified Cytobacillus TaxID=2675268 RepID=UPI0020401FE2|nr:NAD(P)-binding domain-containing protein [Cytobacillus sp. AMY 15.2]MCM3089792.1 NAD(P)-binding domain-containing protein [Cytobacillus sp. AMY 15.2]
MKIGLAGIGKLGTAMMTHWHKSNFSIGIFHPDRSKAKHFAEKFPNALPLTDKEMRQLDIILLALPAGKVISFIDSLIKENSSIAFINMATALPTKVIKDRLPSCKVFGLKYMGHSRDLMENGKGLFITEDHLPAPIQDLFRPVGDIIIDREETVLEVNKQATYFAVKTAVEIETEFAGKGYHPAYVKKGLTSLAPEVIRSYSEGTLGHFANEIVKEIQESKKAAD